MNKFYINLNKLLRSGEGVAKIRIDTTESTTTTTTTTTTTAAPNKLSVAATYSYLFGNGPQTISPDSVSGVGTAASPLVVVLGGSDNQDNRVWIEVQQSGTLSFNVVSSSEDDYDGGRLYITSTSPTQHMSYTILQGTDPVGYTPISSWRDGTNGTPSAGTTSVTAGQYLVLLYTKDSSEQDGTDTITANLYIM